MKVEYLDNSYVLDNKCSVKLKHCGNIKEIIYTQRANKNCYIKKLNNNEYIDLKSGEIKEFIRAEKRIDRYDDLKRSFRNLRDIINTNCLDNKKIKFITLTYAENMQDTKKLYKDFIKFWKKFKYYYDTAVDYIKVVEPQERGAWHLHIIVIFSEDAPKIDFNLLKDKIWGFGRISIQNIDKVDNIGAYLCAYLTDIEVTDTLKEDEIEYFKSLSDGVVVTKEFNDIEGQKVSKKVIKGGRLHFYPSKMQFYSYSKGIKKPKEEILSYHRAKEKIDCSAQQPIFKKVLNLSNDTFDFSSLYVYEQYNIKRIKSQAYNTDVI